MKKIILGMVVFAAALFSMPALSAQENQDNAINNVAVVNDYVQIDMNDLPAETQLIVLETFKGFEIKTIYQSVETKLLKVVVVKDEEEMTFVQKEEGNFVEQE